MLCDSRRYERRLYPNYLREIRGGPKVNAKVLLQRADRKPRSPTASFLIVLSILAIQGALRVEASMVRRSTSPPLRTIPPKATNIGDCATESDSESEVILPSVTDACAQTSTPLLHASFLRFTPFSGPGTPQGITPADPNGAVGATNREEPPGRRTTPRCAHATTSHSSMVAGHRRCGHEVVVEWKCGWRRGCDSASNFDPFRRPIVTPARGEEVECSRWFRGGAGWGNLGCRLGLSPPADSQPRSLEAKPA